MKTTVINQIALACVIALTLGLFTACGTSIKAKAIIPSETDIELVPGETASVGYTLDVGVGEETISFAFPAVEAQEDEHADTSELAESEADDETLAAVEAMVLKWTSSDESVATASEGKITGVSEGKTTITVTVGETSVSTEIAVTVLEPAVTDIEVEPDLPDNGSEDKDGVITIPTNHEFELKTTIKPKGLTGEAAKLTFASEDEEIATVSDKGIVKSLVVGETEITITAASGIEETIKVIVVAGPNGITLGSTEGILTVGNSHKLEAGIDPSDAVGQYTIEWTSSDEKVATVNKHGNVTAVAAGTAIITATIKETGQTIEYTVTVTTESNHNGESTNARTGSNGTTGNTGGNTWNSGGGSTGGGTTGGDTTDGGNTGGGTATQPPAPAQRWVVDTPAWTEQVPVYERQQRAICSNCGADITNIGATAHGNSVSEQDFLNGCGTWHTEWVNILTGYNTVNHPEVGHWE